MNEQLTEKEGDPLDVLLELPEFVNDDCDEAGCVALTVPLVAPWKVRNFEQWKIRVIRHHPNH